jgi:hypothetical protein
MYGWQYPPKLGNTANFQKIAKDLSQTKITYVSTTPAKTVDSICIPATTPEEFAHQASQVIDVNQFDILHAHDYPTYLAALIAHEQTQKPLIIHANETTFDRHEGLRNEEEFALEKKAFEHAHKIIAGNNKVRDRLVASYKIDESKIVSADNILETYKHAKNSYILSGKNKETPCDVKDDAVKEEEFSSSSENILVNNHEKTLAWLRVGLVDFLVGVGIGFLIALFLLSI